MFLPTSGIEISPFSPLLWAFGISMLCSCSGISGAFLLLPYQFSILGYTSPGVSATNQIFNILACPAGVLRFAKEGRLIAPLAASIALGSMPGVLIGAWVRASFLRNAGQFRVFAACVLLYLAFRLLKKGKGASKSKDSTQQACSKVEKAQWKKENGLLYLSWRGEEWTASTNKIFMASLFTGLIGGIYGIGGGAMLSPILVSFFGLPLHLLAGATLFGTFVTSIFGLLSYLLLAQFFSMPELMPDFTLGLLLGAGGIVGMYCGATVQKYINAIFLKRILSVVILFTGLFYVGQSVLTWIK